MSHRNEPARARHRQVLKEQMSLRSIPLVEPPAVRYNLENHFGWKVMQKCRIGDGEFPPYLLHCVYCDKPEVPSGDGEGGEDKVMYVLYIRGKDGDLEKVEVKETQTSIKEALSRIIEAAPPPPEPILEKSKNLRRIPVEKRKMISDFYYIPIKERLQIKYDIRPATKLPSGDEGIPPVGGAAEEKKHKRKKPKAGKGRKKPKSWQLRAGAENAEGDESSDVDSSEEEEEEEEEEEDEEEERGKTFIRNLKRYDCTNCCTPSGDVELMTTPHEKNKYLYLPRERYEKRPQHAGEHVTGHTDEKGLS